MKTMAAKSQLEGRIVNHSSRKTFGTTLLHGGTPLTEVADLGGWKSIESVKHYVTPSIKQQEKASSKLSSVLLPSVSENSETENIDPNSDITKIDEFDFMKIKNQMIITLHWLQFKMMLTKRSLTPQLQIRCLCQY